MMTSLSRFAMPAKFGLGLFAILTWSGLPCSASTPPPPVPPAFQDVYTNLNNYLVSFNSTLNSQWNGVKYPVLFTANLYDADANGGPQVVANNNCLTDVEVQLQELKAMGVQGVMVQVGFPMLYAPFFSSQSQYQQFVTFYENVAAAVRAQGLKLLVDSEALRNGTVLAGWDTGPFYASLNWAQYQQARAQTAVVVAQTMQPDYMVLLEEPDSEATNSGQSDVNTVAGATSMLSLMLSSLQQAGVSGVKLGAGVGIWLPQYEQFIQSFLSLPVDFIDMHASDINYDVLPNALTIASMAAAAGKPVTHGQAWLRKVADGELPFLSDDQILARTPYSFWAPLDAYYVQTMENLAYFTQMSFLNVYQSLYFWAYLSYGPGTAIMTPSQILNLETQYSNEEMWDASFTSPALSYYNSILPAPDTTPPSAPGDPAGSSAQPTQVYLSWNASTDNVGVAGYYVFRNGVNIGTTAQTFYWDNGLTDATTYSYFVEAFDLAGNVSTPSPTIQVTTWNNIPPSQPTNVVGTAVSCQQINLTWSASTGKVAIAGYLVFMGTSANNLTRTGATGGGTSYSIYLLTPSTTYYFGVEAIDADGNISPMSAILSVTTLALPSAPTHLVATPVSATQIALTWSAGPSGMPIVAYYIFRGTTPSNLTQVAIRNVTAFTNSFLTPGTTYYYAVKELDKGGNVSPMSVVVSATTP